jgi:hypothetical protein
MSNFPAPIVNWDIHSAEYTPSNVRVISKSHEDRVSYFVVDWNGVVLAGPLRSWEAANEKRRRRQATIKAAITRRRNKALRTL